MDKSLTAHLLHSYEFLNEAVKGEPDSNNEKFLVEFLNNSSWFRNKVGSNNYDIFAKNIKKGSYFV